MSAFTGPITVTELDVDWRLWRLETPLTYEVGAPGSGKVITVPVGFVTDGASVPRPLQAILPNWGRYSRAAVVHDYLCVCLDLAPHPVATTRKVADGVFYEALRVCGVSRSLAFVMWAACRFGAWGAKAFGWTNVATSYNLHNL